MLYHRRLGGSERKTIHLTVQGAKKKVYFLKLHLKTETVYISAEFTFSSNILLNAYTTQVLQSNYGNIWGAIRQHMTAAC